MTDIALDVYTSEALELPNGAGDGCMPKVALSGGKRVTATDRSATSIEIRKTRSLRFRYIP